MSTYTIVRIMDLVKSIGEDAVKDILSDFSCEYSDGMRNDEVERFLCKNAVDFSRRKMSITYLVVDGQHRVTGYFALTHKPITVQDAILKSKTSKRKMQRHAKFDDGIQAYSVSAFLIAQFSKNYSIPKSERISGEDLMELTLFQIEDIQQQIGGGVVFLECEDQPELIDFYSREPNMFLPFSERYSEADGVKYVQMMRFL